MTTSKINQHQFINQVIDKHKPSIDAYIQSQLTLDQKNFATHSWSEVAFSYLQKFLVSGKTIRGSLLLEVVTQLKIVDPVRVLPLAAAVELIHAGLLIHDDIMDRDQYRRGMETIHTFFNATATRKNYSSPQLFGNSMATCLGDIAFFLGLAELSKVSLPKKSLQQIQNFAMREYVHVGFAQMKDVEFGHSKNQFSIEDITSVYLYKTARYTFSLPFVLAGLSSNLHQQAVQDLEHIGELIGILFQIRDDYLGLFGTSTVTGKPIGTDVIENKKTMYRYFLFEKASENPKYKNVLSLFGQDSLSKDELEGLQNALIAHGVEKSVKKITQSYLHKLETCLQASSLDPKLKTIFAATANFVLARNK